MSTGATLYVTLCVTIQLTSALAACVSYCRTRGPYADSRAEFERLAVLIVGTVLGAWGLAVLLS